MPGLVLWEFHRHARLLELAARVEAARERWRRERLGCPDPAERLWITANLRALGRLARRLGGAIRVVPKENARG